MWFKLSLRSKVNLGTITNVDSILLLIVAIALVVLSGCSANHKSIYRHERVTDSSSVTTIGAKQRAILSTTSSNVRQFCSEPSPDVFSVVAQALSAGGTFSKSADPASIEAALKFAFSDSEQGSSIPRTQTINMLRELMFRTCERYLNGAYNGLEMSIQAVRDQRLMVSILAIEQITGAVTPKPVVVGTSGAASAGLGDTAIVRLDDALKAKHSAEESHKKAEKAFNELNGDNKECDAISDAVKKSEALNDDQKKKQPKCDEARTTLASAKSLLTEKTDHYSDLKRLASVSGINASTSLSSSATGGLDRAHGASVDNVAKTVKEIVELNFDYDTEVMLFCQKSLTGDEFSKLSPTALASLQASCLGYLARRVELEQQKLVDEIQESQARMEAADWTDFERQWATLEKLFNAGKKDDFIKALKKKLITPYQSKADCFSSANSKDSYFKCFESLPSGLKRNLPKVN
jgi:hypothetical protein